MQGILIDPFFRSVTLVEVETGLKAIYAALSGPGMVRTDDDGQLAQHQIDVTVFDIVRLGIDRTGNSVDMFVDGEGLFVTREQGQCYFYLSDDETVLPFAGRALIMGGDREGETVSTGLVVTDVLDKVRWVPFEEHYDAPAPIMLAFDNLDDMLAHMAKRGTG